MFVGYASRIAPLALTAVVVGVASVLCPPLALPLAIAGWTGSSLGVELAKMGIFDFIASKVKELFDWLKQNIRSVIQWLYKRIFQVEGGSDIALLVTDPEGRRVGSVIVNGAWQEINEIPNAFYSGIEAHPQYIAVPEPSDGAYKVVVTGKERSAFKLNTTFISEGTTASIQTVEGTVERGEVEEHSAQILADEGKVYVDAPWWVPVWDQYQFWFIGCLIGTIVFTTSLLKRSTVKRIITARRRRKTKKPKILGVTSVPRIIEVTSTLKILEIKEEE